MKWGDWVKRRRGRKRRCGCSSLGLGQFRRFLLSGRSPKLTSYSRSFMFTLFRQFRGYPGANPSSETASKLDKLVLTSSPSPISSSDATTAPTPVSTRVEISFLGPLPVSYPQIASLVPPLHKSGKYDAIIHVGVASGSKGGLLIEQRGRRTGYLYAGSDNVPCSEEGVANWAGGKGAEEELWTIVDTEGCRDWLEKKMGVEVSCLSRVCLGMKPGGAGRPKERRRRRS